MRQNSKHDSGPSGQGWNPRQRLAPVVLAWAKDTGADLGKTNVHGGAIAMGTHWAPAVLAS
jgi:hypothetical protein